MRSPCNPWTPAESLILKDPARRTGKTSMAEQADSRQRLVKEPGPDDGHRPPAAGHGGAGAGETLRLWQGSRFVHQRSWLGTAVVADLFQLTNTGNAELRVASRALPSRVLAVGVENQALNPGESTRVFVIRQREGRRMILGGKNGPGGRPMLSAAAAAIRRRQALIAGGC